MSGSKPIASLGPLLLARKGTAKPAMRASTAALQSDNDIAACQAELGWDDMGEADDDAVFESTPLVRSPRRDMVTNLDDVRRARARRKGAEQKMSAGQDARRAAFTLRLDADRHLKLKLASAVTGESAQQLVTQALDLLLADMPEIETLAAELGQPKK